MLRVISPRLTAAASVVLAATALLPGYADAAVYLNGSNTTTFDAPLKIIANNTIAAANLGVGQIQGVLTTAVNVNTTGNITGPRYLQIEHHGHC